MASVVWNLVEGIGITPIHELPESMLYFTEISIPETVELPLHKPNMEHLLSVMAEVEIVSIRLIKTTITTSFEGQHLAGLKLIIELKRKLKVKYIADEPTQSVHAAHFEKSLNSAFIVLPKEHDGIAIEDLFANKMLSVTPYIEDIYAAKIDCRKLFINITLLIDAKPNIRTV